MSPLWIVLVLLPSLASSERFSCRGRILGGYYADIKSNCRAFYVCVRVAGGGVRSFRFLCPPGTLFQQEAQTCTDWGDDDGIACPTELYDGLFDLYKIGSGLDTKKTAGPPQREDDEFALQRAETGDRRLNQAPSGSQSDLKASHSSDFFSGRRERGRDDIAESPSSPQPATRAQYRRPPPRANPRPTTYAPQTSVQPTSTAVQFEHHQKRKLVRKRPVQVSTTAAVPTEFTTGTKQYFRSPKPVVEKISFTSASTANPIVINEDKGFVDVVKVSPKVGRYDAPTERPKFTQKTGLTEIYNYNAETSTYNNVKNVNYNKQKVQNNYNPNSNPLNNDNYFIAKNNNVNKQQNNFNNVNNQNGLARNFNEQNNQQKQFAFQNNDVNQQNNNVQNQNVNAQNNFNNQNVPNKNVNFNSHNVPNNNVNFNNQNVPTNNANFNNQQQNFQSATLKAVVRNSFNVAPPPEYVAENEVRKNVEVSPNGVQKPTQNFDNTRFASSTPAFRNFNSVAAEEKKVTKQNYVSATTQKLDITRPTATSNLNPVAYNTNNGFDVRRSHFADIEDDGQYRPPSGEDDGQYRPELYERESELLSGAHSINIAASKNQLQEQPKQRRPEAQTAAPRPFSASPNTQAQYPTTPRIQQRPRTENVQQYQTTQRVQPTQQFVEQSYTTTKRPEFPPQSQTTFEYDNSVFTTRRPVTQFNTPTTYNTPRPSSVAPQQYKQESAKPHVHKHKPTSPLSKPSSPKEDASYDYAYYDTDSGFTEYDQIEEFEKTKKKV